MPVEPLKLELLLEMLLAPLKLEPQLVVSAQLCAPSIHLCFCDNQGGKKKGGYLFESVSLGEKLSLSKWRQKLQAFSDGGLKP